MFLHICVHPISNIAEQTWSSRVALYLVSSDISMYFTIYTIVRLIYFVLELHTPLDAKNTMPVAIWFEKETRSYVFSFATSPSPR